MKILTKALLVPTCCGILLFGCSNGTTQQNPDTVSADNTQRNADKSAPTAEQQGNSQADLDMSANIRKAILEDKTLSFNAQNVKIITSGGLVTLRGPVESVQEKAAVEAKAQLIAGASKVVSLLEIEKRQQ